MIVSTLFISAIRIIGALLLGMTVLELVELIDLIVYRGRPQHHHQPVAGRELFVSIHVPICSEPPEIVAATLLALKRLKYKSFEVLVVDNNTKDESLWRPVESLCRRLGGNFHFFHLPQWPGFKAGALNFALRNTAPQASVIGIIDSDYQVFPDYLSELMPYFQDGRVGFVQAPQDYREWSGNYYSRICYWEYWQFFAVGMVLRSERDAIQLHGTMNLIRKETLLNLGGWAEWCLTEDTELGIRILSHGHKGVYVFKTLGLGLIPFSYSAFKRQRHRWVTGGAQTAKAHWRLLIPSCRRGSRLGFIQTLHYLQGWLPWVRDAFIVLLSPVVVLLGVLTVIFRIPITRSLVPIEIGFAGVLLHAVIRQWTVYRIYLSVSWLDTIGASLMIFGLTWTIGTSWLGGWLPLPRVFSRTPKRPIAGSWINDVVPEIFMAILTSSLLTGYLVQHGFRNLQMPSILCFYALSAWSAVLCSFTASLSTH